MNSRSWSRLDPREVALRYPTATLALLVTLWGAFAYGNALTPRGAILEDPIVNSDDRFRQMDHYVQSRVEHGFRGQADRVSFVLYFDPPIHSLDDLARIREFADRVRRELGEPVSSLASFPYFTDDGEEIRSDPHIPNDPALIADVEAWKDRVRDDPAVYGTLVGRNFEYATVLWFLPPGVDEIAAFRRVAAFVEERTIESLEWFYKRDLEVPAGLGLGSLSVRNGLTDQGMKTDVLVLIGLGVGLTFPLFVFAFRSYPPAFLAIIVVVLGGFVWTRGLIGLLSLLDPSFKERVYCSVAYANCIVQGTSFALHKYDAFYQSFASGSREPFEDRASLWRRSRSIDNLIAFAACLGILGFASLYWFEVRAIRESALMGVVGVAAVFINAVFFLPVVDSLVMGRRRPNVVPEPNVERWLQGLRTVGERIPPRHAIIALLGFVAVATMLMGPTDKLPMWSRHLEFAGDTIARRTADYLNEADRPGASLVDILVEPTGQDDIRSPEFLARSAGFVKAVGALDDTRSFSTILTSVQRVSSELLGYELPRTRAESSAVFSTIEGGLERALATSLYYPNGIRLSVQTAIERSDQLAGYIDTIESIAHTQFPELRVSPYGGGALYPQWDRYIRQGAPSNVGTSLWIVVLLFALRIAWHNRRRPDDAPALHPFWGGLAAAVPFLFSISVLVMLMSGIEIPLDAATATITALVINASIDFSIYLVDEFQRGLREGHSPHAAAWRAVQRKGRVILADTTMNACCFVPLLMSQFFSLQNVGKLMPVILFSCAVGALVLMAAILPLAARGARQRPATATDLQHRRSEEVFP